jgi:hypothetical protein
VITGDRQVERQVTPSAMVGGFHMQHDLYQARAMRTPEARMLVGLTARRMLWGTVLSGWLRYGHECPPLSGQRDNLTLRHLASCRVGCGKGECQYIAGL